MTDTTVYPYGSDAPPAPSAADLGTLLTSLRAGQLASREDMRVVEKCICYGTFTFYGPPAPGPAPAPPPSPGPLRGPLKSHCASAASSVEASHGDLGKINWLQLLPLLLELLKAFTGG